jgi:CheY-like chemotaxis protein
LLLAPYFIQAGIPGKNIRKENKIFDGHIPNPAPSPQNFSRPTETDLIFSDIQLGDGLSLEVFSRIDLKIPAIFCTAFDEYALQAFKANGIDYILKPFTLEALKAAIDKYIEHDAVYIAHSKHTAHIIEVTGLDLCFQAAIVGRKVIVGFLYGLLYAATKIDMVCTLASTVNTVSPLFTASPSFL